MSDPDVQNIPIGWGFSARYTYPDWHRVTIAFRFRNRELFEHTLDADAEVEQHTLDLGFAVVVLTVESDLGA